MKIHHLLLIVLVALILGALEFYYDAQDAILKKPNPDVRVVYEDPIYDPDYVEDDNE